MSRDEQQPIHDVRGRVPCTARPNDQVVPRRLRDLIERANRGDETAINQLFEIEYDQLKKMAAVARSTMVDRRVLGTQTIIHNAFINLRVRNTQLELSTTDDFRKYV